MPNITLYYAEWCGHCQRFKPEWERLKKTAKDKYPSITVEDYEQGKNPEVMRKAGINGYPTIKVNGKEYNGKRNAEEILKTALSEQKGGSRNDEYYKKKYIKYKAKYFELLSNLN